MVGLTTAASIWLVAAVGLLVGSGLYSLAAFTTVGGFITLRWGRHAGRRVRRRRSRAAELEGEDVVFED